MEKTLKDALRALSEPPEALPTVGFVIEVASGPDQGKTLTVAGPRVLIGTSPVCELVLTDERVSRRHLALTIVDQALKVEDLDSTNGTFTNAMRISGAYLRGGETITIGKSLLLVTLSAAVEGEGPPPRAVSFGRVLGTSTKMQRVYQLAKRVAASDIPCTIEGETGTGKEQLAEAIHESSPRAKGPFIVFDCTALPGTLMESALFGHEKGSFTGAAATRRGVFEQADGGTLFIDEIGDLPLAIQAKVLRALQSGEVQPVGGRPEIVDVRLVAATNKDLAAESRAGRFREDLYYRLAVVPVRIPPLRDRAEDIAPLTHAFAASYAERYGMGRVEVEPQLVEAFQAHTWPGNVRELENTVARLLALAPDDRLTLALYRSVAEPVAPASRSSSVDPGPGLPLRARVEAFERGLIEAEYDTCSRNQSETARRLGISRPSLVEKLRKYGLLER